MKITTFMVPFLTLAILAMSCSTTTTNAITNEHRNEKWQTRPLENMLVIGVYDRTYRNLAESIFVAELTAKRVNANAGFEIFPDLEALDETSQVRKAIDGKGFDAILTITTVKREKEFDYDDWWASYGLWVVLSGSNEKAGRVTSDDYSQSEYHIDIGLFDTKTLEPIWNATTDSYALSAGADEIKILADFIVGELAQRGLIK